MKCFLAFVFVIMIAGCNPGPPKTESSSQKGPITLVIHGGAGTITRQNMTPEREQLYHQKLKVALDSGYAVLEKGGKSVDAVIAAVKLLEDSPLFNAGKGAVFNNDGINELDASIMDGNTLMAGAVAGVTTIKNPITAAHAVMTRADHVILIAKGAERFAEEHGVAMVPQSYFFDSLRYEQLQKLKQADNNSEFERDKKFGTVGCVALDKDGNLAAGTSTGGMTNKKYGRVGDSPIIGAGTYANNVTCAISATGWGEYFIRLSVAHDIHALMEYAGLSVQQASDSVVLKKLTRLGGNGGVIGLDRQGNFTMTFSTEGMYRGYIVRKGEAKTFIYSDDKE